MNYTEAKNAIKDTRKYNSDILDSFFLPLMLSLGYTVGFGGNTEDDGLIIMNHQQHTLTANLKGKDKIVFLGSEKPELNYSEHEIYVYVSEQDELVAELPRFRTIYNKYTIKFDSAREDKSNFDELIKLISLPDVDTNSNFMGTLQFDTDLDAFIDGEEHQELLQAVQHIVNTAVATNDADFIEFLLKKVHENYQTKFTDVQIRAIIVEDTKRRFETNMQYSLVDNNVLNDNAQKNNVEKTDSENSEETADYANIFNIANEKPTDKVVATDKEPEEDSNELKPVSRDEESEEDKPSQVNFKNLF